MKQKNKFFIYPLLTLSFVLVLSSSCKKDPDAASSNLAMTDGDGNVYSTVKIGNQVWTVGNLRTTKFNDGTSIPNVTGAVEWKNLKTPGYSNYQNTSNSDSIKKFGAIYNWPAVDSKKLAPKGWHVPTNADWDTLTNYLIANGYNFDDTKTGNKIAKSLSSKTDWASSYISGAIGNDLTKNNKSGFSALPAGSRESSANTDAKFTPIGEICDFWTSTPYSTIGGYYIRLNYDFVLIDRGSKSPLNSGHVVRLVKD